MGVGAVSFAETMAQPHPTSDQAWLERLARSLTTDTSRADDAVQETWLRALRARGRGAPVPSHRGFLARVLRNSVHDEVRGRERRRAREERRPAALRSSVPATDAVVARHEAEALLRGALEALDEPYRSTLEQRFLDGDPPRVIAARAGLPVRTVHTRLERGLARLRARLDARHGGERRLWLEGLAPFACVDGRPLCAVSSALVPASVLGALSVKAALSMAVAAGLVLALALRSGNGPVVDGFQPAEGRVGAVQAQSAVPDLEEPSAADDRTGPVVPPREPDTLAPRTVPVFANLEVEVRASAVAGAGLEGVRVRVDAVSALDGAVHPPRQIGSQTTDAEGWARFEGIPAGRRLRVTATPPSWKDPNRPLQRGLLELEPLDVGEEARRVLELSGGLDRVFLGQVVAAEDERPIAGARIEPFGRGVREVSVTGEDGRFRRRYASWRANQVCVRAPGRSLALVELHESGGETFVIELERSAALDVVFDAFQVESATVRVVADAGALLRPGHGRPEEAAPEWSAEVEPGGRVLLSELPAGVELAVELRRAGELSRRLASPLVLEPGETRELVLRPEVGTRLVGRLLVNGEVAEGSTLWLVPQDGAVRAAWRYFDGDEEGRARSARSAAGGRFVFEDVPVGDYWIGPRAFGPRAGGRGEQALAARAVRITLEPGELQRDVELEGFAGLSIRGRVTSPGTKRDWVWVSASPQEGGGYLRTAVAPDGSFDIHPLAPGPHSLRAAAADVHAWARNDILAMAGDEGVELVLAPGPSISGRVLDGLSGAPADAHVALLFPGGGSMSMGTSSAGVGMFHFASLNPGTYALSATTVDGRVGTLAGIVLERDGTVADLELGVSPGSRLSVIYRGGPERLRCHVGVAGATLDDGKILRGDARTVSVPPGQATVLLYGGSGGREVRETRDVLLTAGKSEVLEVQLDAWPEADSSDP